MRILVLGGTVFLGRHVVDAARARGHELTLYSRGIHGSVPEGVEHVTGDRADLTPLQGREWDAVIDTSGYDPAHVEASTRLSGGHYVFVSTCNVYPAWADEPVDEDSPVWLRGRGLRAGQGRGRARRAPERRDRPRRPDRRPARQRLPPAVVGPADRPGRRRPRSRAPRPPGAGDRRPRPRGLPARPRRAARDAARSTAPGRSGRRRWASCSPPPGAAELRWIPDETLEKLEVEPWIELPLWLPEGYAWQVGTDKAQAAGLRCRPVAETVADIAAWLSAGGEDELDDWRAEHRPPPMSAEREAELLRAASLPPSRPE